MRSDALDAVGGHERPVLGDGFHEEGEVFPTLLAEGHMRLEAGGIHVLLVDAVQEVTRGGGVCGGGGKGTDRQARFQRRELEVPGRITSERTWQKKIFSRI